jgi:hypothetical protein
MSGDLGPCCKNGTSFGKWTTEGVGKVWTSEKYQAFRKDIVDGKFPDTYCDTCFHNGTAMSLRQLTQKPLKEFTAALKGYYPRIYPFVRIRLLWNKIELDDEAQTILRIYFKQLDQCDALIDRGEIDEAAQLYVRKLYVLGKIVRDFLAGETAPEVVAPRWNRTICGKPYSLGHMAAACTKARTCSKRSNLIFRPAASRTAINMRGIGTCAPLRRWLPRAVRLPRQEGDRDRTGQRLPNF